MRVTEKNVVMASVEPQCAPPSDAGPQESAHTPHTAADNPPNHQTASPNSSASTSPCEGERATVSDKPHSPPITTERPKRAKRSRNLSRERLHSELKHLRALSTELEERLITLQQQPHKTPGVIQEEERQRALVARKYLAERQLCARTRSEKLNVKLRAQLQSSVKMAKRLQQAAFELSTRPQHPVSFGGLFELSDAFPKQMCVVPEDVAMYETLANQADAAFSRMESVFQANGLSTWRTMDAETLAKQSQMKTQRLQSVDDKSALVIELIEADALPFAKESVFRIMWRCWEQHYMAKNVVLYEFSQRSAWHDTVAGKMHFDVPVNGDRVPLQIVFVLKWFIADERICYVLRSVSTADGTHISGACIDETGWTELRAVPAHDDAHGVEGTLTLSCSHLKSEPHATISDPEIEFDVAAPLASSMISSFEADSVEVSCLMMDLLLEETSPAPVSRAL